jgi:hypothetical protein
MHAVNPQQPEGTMLKKLPIVIGAVLVFASLCNALEVGGIHIPDFLEVAGISAPDSLETGPTRLILNGAGVRTKFFLKLYVGGLYLEQKCSDPKHLIEADEPMAIRLHITSSLITSKKMEKVTREGFVKATDGKIAPIEAQIETFISVFRERINEDDIYDLIYVPGKGVEVHKNQKFHSLTEGFPFKQALFGIWLCENPAQKSLKKKMLGK